ncbi:hypothetical protein ACOME3_007620 [Neoechinorhynchus agilis]
MSGVNKLRSQVHREAIATLKLTNNTGANGLCILSEDECTLIADYFFERLVFLCKEMEITSDVVETSMHYYKRFFLHQSVLMYSPLGVMLGCIFLAAKTEESGLTVDVLANAARMLFGKEDVTSLIRGPAGTQTTPKDLITGYETSVIEMIDYDLHVYHASTLVEAWLIDLRAEFLRNSPEDIANLRVLADQFLHAMYFTDAIFVYSPHMLTVAAITRGIRELSGSSVAISNTEYEEFLTTKVLMGNDEDYLTSARECIRELFAIYDDAVAKLTDRSAVSDEILDKLKTCNVIASDMRAKDVMKNAPIEEIGLDTSF